MKGKTEEERRCENRKPVMRDVVLSRDVCWALLGSVGIAFLCVPLLISRTNLRTLRNGKKPISGPEKVLSALFDTPHWVKLLSRWWRCHTRHYTSSSEEDRILTRRDTRFSSG